MVSHLSVGLPRIGNQQKKTVDCFFQVMASAPSNTNLLLWEQLDADTTHDNSDVLRECDVIFMAVKPNMFQVKITCPLPVETVLIAHGPDQTV